MPTRAAIAAIATMMMLVAAASSVACDDDEGGEPTATSQPPTAAATGTGEPAVDIRTLDLESDDAVRALVASTGGTYEQDNVIYADVTDDGADDAVVPISSGGTMGDVGYVVLAAAEGGAEPVLERSPGGPVSVEVSGGQVVETLPAPGPDDPECCPSQLRTITYTWDGAALVVESDETRPNPAGGAKTSTP